MSCRRRVMMMASASLSPVGVLPSADAARQVFAQLASAIQSGALTAAQSASSASAQPGNANPNGPFAAAVSQIGAPRQSGNIDRSQQDLSSLQKQFRSAKGARHPGRHHVGDGDPSKAATPPSSTTTGNSASTGTTSGDPTAPTTLSNLVNLKA